MYICLFACTCRLELFRYRCLLKDLLPMQISLSQELLNMFVTILQYPIWRLPGSLIHWSYRWFVDVFASPRFGSAASELLDTGASPFVWAPSLLIDVVLKICWPSRVNSCFEVGSVIPVTGTYSMVKRLGRHFERLTVYDADLAFDWGLVLGALYLSVLASVSSCCCLLLQGSVSIWKST